MLSLIDRLLVERPDLSVLVTTGTVTSARLLATRLPPGRAWHQYVPVDRAAYVRRFLEHWRPDLALWVESELWPNLITETLPQRHSAAAGQRAHVARGPSAAGGACRG